MNIKFKKEQSNLNESQQMSPTPIDNLNTNMEEVVMKTKSKQFTFESGLIMAGINVEVDTRFGLKWHFDKSPDVTFFIESVKTFISATNYTVSDRDIKMLTKQYERKSKKS